MARTPLTGAAERIVWETVHDMEGFRHCAGEKDRGDHAGAHALELVRFPVVWAWDDTLRILWGGFAGDCVVASSINGRYSLKGALRSRARPSRPSLLGRCGAACSFSLCCKMH